ncbi:hypothetical protein RJ640_027888 [Escallonia rubra]|uniref:Uncharacterized protein n=1 Tax=Escallonia rubra TaxID=112253 RepID=A0AA88UTQ9_9ASTE|nr:hypothetical protein RJ640_027888 [Escallonia rubra]
MANSKERIDALEAQMANMFKSDHHAPGILKQFSLRLDALEENLERTDNARHAESVDWESKFQELQDRVELLSRAVVNMPAGGMEHSSRPRVPEPKSYGGARDAKELENILFDVGNPEGDVSGEKPKDTPPRKKGDIPEKGLMYLDVKVNRKAIRAMVDTGAKHNYIYSTEVERLGLTLEKGCGRVKAINSAAQPVDGIARSVLIKVGPYEGRTNFSVVTMDDFKLILVLEFLRDTKTTVMPCTNSLAMLGNKPCVIPTISPRAGECSISALQLKKGLKRDETTYLAMLRWDEIEELSGPLPRQVKMILNDFEDMMPDVPKKLPPRRAIDHEIELARWQELLAEFNFMLEYKAGSTNSVADALSRRTELDHLALAAMNAIVRSDSRVAINIRTKIKKALTKDPCSSTTTETGRERSSTGKSAFEIVNGQQPLLPRTVNVPNTGKSPRAVSFSEEWRQNIDLAHSYLERAAKRMKKHAEKNRRSQEFNVDDKVMVKLLPQDRKFLRGRDSRLL